jgi:hypothetical protein
MKRDETSRISCPPSSAKHQPGADFLSDLIDRTHAADNHKLTFGSIIR